MSNLCLIAVRNEERYLPGFLRHVRDHVDGIVALDDCSTDGTADILRQEPRVVSILREETRGLAHANETSNRHRLLVEAARLDARWVLCADVDERFEEAFLSRLPEEIERGERTGRPVRYVRRVNLWNSPAFYRVDGVCGPRWTVRLFKLPKQLSRRPFALHKPWFPPEIDDAPRAYMNAYVYHFGMIERRDREIRFAKFQAIDPDNLHQASYRHLIDEANLKLKPVLPWRRYADLASGPSSTPTLQVPLAGTADTPKPLLEAEFDEAYYLRHNIDVQRRVAEGRIASGWQHFERRGVNERRHWRRKPTLRGFDFGSIFSQWREAKS